MGKDLKKHWYSKMWDFVTRPKTLYDEAKVNKDADGKKIDKKLKDKEGLGFFATLKHIFWPSSTGGKLAYGTVAATAAAGVVGGFKYAEHREDQRKSSTRDGECQEEYRSSTTAPTKCNREGTHNERGN